MLTNNSNKMQRDSFTRHVSNEVEEKVSSSNRQYVMHSSLYYANLLYDTMALINSCQAFCNLKSYQNFIFKTTILYFVLTGVNFF